MRPPIGVQYCFVHLLDEDAYHTYTWRSPTASNLWQDMITEGAKTGALTC